MDEVKLFAFVLMPFDSTFEDLYRFGIKEPAAELGAALQRRHFLDQSTDRSS